MRTGTSWNMVDDQPYSDQIKWNNNSCKLAHKKSEFKIDLTEVFKANQLFTKTEVIEDTPIMKSEYLSQEFEASIFLKRQDRQNGKTFKIRGAYYQYLISDEKRKQKGFVIASDGNFAVSMAVICGMFKWKGTIFVPSNCFPNKIEQIKRDGKQFIDLIQIGQTFQQCTHHAIKFSEQHKIPYIKSYQTPSLFIGYATMAKEIIESQKKISYDYILVPTGGGALVSSTASVVKQLNPDTKVIAVEPQMCKPFSHAVLQDQCLISQKTSKFCNGSSVQTTSDLAYQMGKTSVDGFVEVSERRIAARLIKLYGLGITCEPAGVLAVAALEKIRDVIKGKNILCILSGANIDLVKLNEAKEMSMISKGVKNFYLINAPNKKGIIYDLITKCFKDTDSISIQYSQRFGKEASQVLLSVQSQTQEDAVENIEKMNENNYSYQNLNDQENMLDLFF